MKLWCTEVDDSIERTTGRKQAIQIRMDPPPKLQMDSGKHGNLPASFHTLSPSLRIPTVQKGEREISFDCQSQWRSADVLCYICLTSGHWWCILLAFGVEGLISMVLSGVMTRLGCKDSCCVENHSPKSWAVWHFMVPYYATAVAPLESIWPCKNRRKLYCKMVRSCEQIGQ